MDDHIRENLRWNSEQERAEAIQKVKMAGTYAPLMEKVRKAFPTEQLCRLTCSGKSCKHCNPDVKNVNSVVKGLDAQWVTNNILACSRPGTRRIKEFQIIDQFKSLGINSILNVQEPGEHNECGDPLEKESGFSYNPSDFMQNGVFFYNFPFPDFSVPTSHSQVIDIIQVFQFAVSVGKIAVHCHAGRGRTGLVIACYLVYNDRLSPSEAISYIRQKRTGSIQTQDQVDFIVEFENFLKRIRNVYSVPSVDAEIEHFTIEQYLGWQSYLIKGKEAKVLRYIPRILFVLIRRILQLLGVNFGLRKSFNNIIVEFEELPEAKLSLSAVLPALVYPYTLGADIYQPAKPLSPKLDAEILAFKRTINQEPDSGYDLLAKESRIEVLSALLWNWLDSLSEPALRFDDVERICRSRSQSTSGKLQILERSQAHTAVLFASFLKAIGLKAKSARLDDESDESRLIDVLALRCLTHLTQSRFNIDLVDLMRLRNGGVKNAASGIRLRRDNSVANSNTLSLSISASSMFDDSASGCSIESTQPFMWSSNAYRLGAGHKRRLVAFFLDCILELKCEVPNSSTSTQNNAEPERKAKAVASKKKLPAIEIETTTSASIPDVPKKPSRSQPQAVRDESSAPEDVPVNQQTAEAASTRNSPDYKQNGTSAPVDPESRASPVATSVNLS